MFESHWFISEKSGAIFWGKGGTPHSLTPLAARNPTFRVAQVKVASGVPVMREKAEGWTDALLTPTGPTEATLSCVSPGSQLIPVQLVRQRKLHQDAVTVAVFGNFVGVVLQDSMIATFYQHLREVKR